MSPSSRGIMQGLFRTVSVGVVSAVLAAGVMGGLFLYFTLQDLPDISSLKEYQTSAASVVFSADGERIGEFTEQRRYFVPFEEIPKHVLLSFISAEDSSFYEHRGIDPAGILRALISNILRGGYKQGGSTITQQVARSVVLKSRAKKITRKIREMVLAWRMEKELSKNEILHLYLSEIYLGHGAFGIGAAARNYFNKSVGQLTLAEASMLAGLPQRPHDWNPFRNPHLTKKRQQYVLNRMVSEGYIKQEQATQALGEPLKLYELENINKERAAFFTEHVRQYVMGKYGSDTILTSGYKVYTTLNYRAQKKAEEAVMSGLREVDKRLGWRGVKANIDSEIDIEARSRKSHETVIGDITRVRILPPFFTEEEKSLQYDLTPFQAEGSAYFGATPVKVGGFYEGIVTAIEATKNEATVRVGDTFMTLPAEGLKWVLVNEKPAEQVAQVLKVGDVIDVKVTEIKKAEKQIIAHLEQYPEVQGALLSFDVKNGFVQAMVGGRDFRESEFNSALQAKRQVGSTFKPIVYAAALDKGFSPSSVVTDSPIVFKFEGDLDADNVGEDWRPKNYGGRFRGDIPLRLALVRSMNIPTVKVLNQISVDYVIEYARRLGITAVMPRDLSIGLGSWSSSLEEVTRAYAVFARGGKPVKLHFVTKVVDLAGNVLESYNPEDEQVVRDMTNSEQPSLVEFDTELPPGHVLTPETSYIMVDLLKAVVQEGTGRRASVIRGEVAGKTGTSNDHRDAWFIGFTPNLMTGVWVGYEKDRPLESGETGGRAAAPIWVDYMGLMKNIYPMGRFPVPEGVVFSYVDRETGRLAQVGNPDRVRVAFKPNMVPSRDGENLPRIGEPGNRARIERPSAATDGEEGYPQPSLDDSETADFLRQGYQ